MKQPQIHESPTEFLKQWLSINQFKRVGYVGSFPQLSDDIVNEMVLLDITGLEPRSHHNRNEPLQAVILAEVIDSLNHKTAVQLLAGYRNALVGAILALTDARLGRGLPDNDFFGLGFKKIAEFPHPEHPLVAFEYNLNNYNHERLWNNAKFWANPENFGKYWW